jgi:WD40 repeat protein
MDEISLEIDENIDNDKPHNSKPITKIVVSPNCKYLVTYSRDDKSIFGWNVKNKDEGSLELDQTIKSSDIGISSEEMYQICVSDDKKLVFYQEYGRELVIRK